MKIYDELIKSLPEYERKSYLIQEILKSIADQLTRSNEKITVNLNEIFIDTANKALELHARDLGISFPAELKLEQRRELIEAYYRASFEQTTEDTIKNIAIAFSNGEVEINSTDQLGVFEIKFVGSRGIPNNVEGLKKTISTIIPAHLEFIYTYVFNVWNDTKEKTWNEISDYTWDEVVNKKYK